jgi:hypothetical protein
MCTWCATPRRAAHPQPFPESGQRVSYCVTSSDGRCWGAPLGESMSIRVVMLTAAEGAAVKLDLGSGVVGALFMGDSPLNGGSDGPPRRASYRVCDVSRALRVGVKLRARVFPRSKSRGPEESLADPRVAGVSCWARFEGLGPWRFGG